MTDHHVHIGQFNEVYYDAHEVFAAIEEAGAEVDVDEARFSSTSSCRDDVELSKIEEETEYALFYSGRLKVRPYLWFVPSYGKGDFGFLGGKIVRLLRNQAPPVRASVGLLEPNPQEVHGRDFRMVVAEQKTDSRPRGNAPERPPHAPRPVRPRLPRVHADSRPLEPRQGNRRTCQREQEHLLRHRLHRPRTPCGAALPRPRPPKNPLRHGLSRHRVLRRATFRQETGACGAVSGGLALAS